MEGTTATAAMESTARIANAFVMDSARRMLIAQLQSRRAVLEFSVQGSSMSGSLPSGCRIRIACEKGIPGAGAVIGVLIGGRVMRVHRVVRRGRRAAARGWLFTRGDSLTFPDMPHDEATVLGRVTEVQIDGVWRPVPTAPRHRRPVLSGTLALLIAIALEIEPSFAMRAARGLHRLKLVYYRLASGFVLPRRAV